VSGAMKFTGVLKNFQTSVKYSGHEVNLGHFRRLLKFQEFKDNTQALIMS